MLSCFFTSSVSFFIILSGVFIALEMLSLTTIGIGFASGFMSCDLVFVNEQNKSKNKSM